MKKSLLKISAVLLITASLTSCATVFGGKISDCQRTKPAEGKPPRQIRAAALILDVAFLFPLGPAIDFATGAIYKPCTKK